jgi:hypothetical protein
VKSTQPSSRSGFRRIYLGDGTLRRKNSYYFLNARIHRWDSLEGRRHVLYEMWKEYWIRRRLLSVLRSSPDRRADLYDSSCAQIAALALRQEDRRSVRRSRALSRSRRESRAIGVAALLPAGRSRTHRLFHLLDRDADGTGIPRGGISADGVRQVRVLAVRACRIQERGFGCARAAVLQSPPLINATIPEPRALGTRGGVPHLPERGRLIWSRKKNQETHLSETFRSCKRPFSSTFVNVNSSPE